MQGANVELWTVTPLGEMNRSSSFSTPTAVIASVAMPIPALFSKSQGPGDCLWLLHSDFSWSLKRYGLQFPLAVLLADLTIISAYTEAGGMSLERPGAPWSQTRFQ